MASFKQHNTKRSHLSSKMEPKVGIGPRGLVGANRTVGGGTCTRSFKVYSESENPDVKSRNRKSMPVNSLSATSSVSCAKGVLKCTEPGNSKNYSSAKQMVGRTALADVSNVQSGSSNRFARISLKPPVSTTFGTRNAKVLPRKSVQAGCTQRVSESSLLKKALNKALKAPSDSQRIIPSRLTREPIVAIDSGMTRKPSVLKRKSFPVFKRASQLDVPKVNSGKSEKEKGERTFKVTVGKKEATKPSTNLMRNRASDAFFTMRQNKLDSRVPLRTSIKSTVKIAVKTTDSVRNKTSILIKGPNKSANVAILKNKQAIISSVCGDLKQELVPEKASCDKESKASTSDVTVKKNSRRRRSYTSKFLEAHDDALKHESIDDEGNQLEVSDYVDDIYQYYWVTEAQTPHMGNLMSIQHDVTPSMRAVLINWLIEVHHKYDLMQETLYLMITLLDQFLSQVAIKKSEMQLVGLTALLLASKYEDFWHPRVQELLAISAEKYTRDQMLDMEKLILKTLKFRLNTPTPYVFMLRFLKAAQSDVKLERLAYYLIELCLVEYDALMFKPSLLCASAIYVARSTLQLPPWTPLLRRHARYEESQLREGAAMIWRFHKAAKTSMLKVTYDKFMNADLSAVAAIKPMDRLPL